MGSFSIWHWLIVLVIVLVLFGGGGKITAIMGDIGKGIRSFKKGLNEDGSAATPGPAVQPDPAGTAPEIRIDNRTGVNS